MSRADVEREASRLENMTERCAWGARYAWTLGMVDMASEAEGAAHGFAFRAAELRYDARGGMTEELERRRFEPGARWLMLGAVREVTGQGVRFHNIMVEFDDRTAFELGTLTRANGWLFLGLGQGAEPGRRP